MSDEFEQLLVRYGPAEARVRADIMGIQVPEEPSADSRSAEYEPADVAYSVEEAPREMVDEVLMRTPATPTDPAPRQRGGRLTFTLSEGAIRMKYLWASASVGAPPEHEVVIFRVLEDDLVFSPKAGSLVRVTQKAAVGAEAEAMVECIARVRESETVDMLVLRVVKSGMEKTGRINDGAPSSLTGRPSVRVQDGEPLAEGESPPSPDDQPSAADLASLWKAARKHADTSANL